VAITKMAAAVEDMAAEDTPAAAADTADNATKATVVAPAAAEDGAEDSNSPTAAEVTAVAASKAATVVDSRVAMTRTNSRVVVNEFPKPRTVEQIQARAAGAHRSSF